MTAPALRPCHTPAPFALPLVAAAGAAAILAGTLGCGGPSTGTDAGPDPTDAGPPTLEIGTGNSEYIALMAAADLEIFAGAQGGYHTYVSVRTTGLACADVSVLARVYEADGTTILGEVTYMVDLTADPGGTKDYVGVVVILAPWSSIPLATVMAELTGRPLVLEVTVTDTEGRTVTTAVDVVGACCTT